MNKHCTEKISERAVYQVFHISSAIRKKGKSYKCYKKTKHAKFSEKRTFLTPWDKHGQHVLPFWVITDDIKVGFFHCKIFNCNSWYGILLRDCHQINFASTICQIWANLSTFILPEITKKQSFPDDFSGNRSWMARSNLLNNRSEIWLWFVMY